MAPEQWNDGPATPATDIYAATAVFFECLTGTTPFSGPTWQLAAQHRVTAVPVERVDEPLRALITRGMAKDPAARPGDAVQFLAELEATAEAAYGADWEAQGRSRLAERAAALLLLLLQHGTTATAGGTATTTASASLPGSSQGAQGPQPAHAGQATGSSSQAGEAHAAHLRHLEHLAHLRAERAKEEAQAGHAAHLHHVEHVEHVADVSRGDGEQPARRRPRPRGRARLMTVPAVAIAAVVIGVVAALAATSHHSPPPSGTPSPGTITAAAPGPQPGVITVDDDGMPLNAKVLAVAAEVLTDARNHDSAALDRLLDPTDPTSAQVIALNNLLARPGVYQQIITLLTKTHSSEQSGVNGWPGFGLGINTPLDAADAKTLGVTSAQDYKGITINIGDAFNASPYAPRLMSIS